MAIEDRLRELRKKSGMTLEELAKKIGVSKQTVQRYETGVIKNIPSDKIESLSAFLDTTPGYLMGWTDNPDRLPPAIKLFPASNIRYLRRKHNYSQDFIAEKLGCKSYTTIQKWEMGIAEPSPAKLKEFADIFGVNIDDLTSKDLEREDLSTGEPWRQTIINVFPITTKKLPLLGEIACGVPKFANEDRESYIDVSTDLQADFCLKASGDSMINARIQDGDIVFIRQQEMVENGEIAAVVVNSDTEATLKRVYFYPEKSLLILKAENPAVADLIFNDEELGSVHILGKAIAFQSDVI